MDSCESSRRDSAELRAFELLPVGAVWTRDGLVLHSNQMAAALLGMRQRTEPVRDWARRLTLVDDDGAPLRPAHSPLLGVLHRGRAQRRIVRLCRDDGSRLRLEIAARPLGVEGRGAIAIFEDLSWLPDEDQRCAQWLGALSHELNGVVGSVTFAASELLKRTTPKEARSRQQLERILANAGRINRLVAGYIDAARLGENALRCQLEAARMQPLIDTLVDRRLPLRPDQPLLLRVEPGVAALCDRDWTMQILFNLLSNAAKYASAGPVELGAKRRQERVHLWVKDSGPGIPRARRRELFRRYVRLPSAEQGSGIGLWLCRELAGRMGGAMTLDSDVGCGSVFSLVLPAARVRRTDS